MADRFGVCSGRVHVRAGSVRFGGVRAAGYALGQRLPRLRLELLGASPRSHVAEGRPERPGVATHRPATVRLSIYLYVEHAADDPEPRRGGGVAALSDARRLLARR